MGELYSLVQDDQYKKHQFTLLKISVKTQGRKLLFSLLKKRKQAGTTLIRDLTIINTYTKLKLGTVIGLKCKVENPEMNQKCPLRFDGKQFANSLRNKFEYFTSWF